MKKSSFFLGAFLATTLLTCNAYALLVDVTTEPTDTGTHIDFFGTTLLGSFNSPDIQFLTNFADKWYPFGMIGFGADITGAINVAATGTYLFTLNSDDGSYLFIDGNLVVNDGNNHFPQVVSNSVLLTAGVHSLEVQFHEDGTIFSGVDLNLSSGVTYVSSSVPEGGTTLLLAIGAFGLLCVRKMVRV